MELNFLAALVGRGIQIVQRQSVLCANSANYKFRPIRNFGTFNVIESPEIKHMRKLLEKKFPLAKTIDVVDISSGCGDMYEVNVESVEFKGLTTVKQHRLVTEALKNEIKDMHGIRIQTTIPPESMK